MRILYRWLMIGALVVCSVAPASAQSPVGQDSIASRIGAIFAPFARTDAPGCVVGVYRAGAVVFTATYGMADVAHHIPLTDTSRMMIASTSKQFTAFAVLLLEAEGKVRRCRGLPRRGHVRRLTRRSQTALRRMRREDRVRKSLRMERRR